MKECEKRNGFSKNVQYFINAATDAVRNMEKLNFGIAMEQLKTAQAVCEELYICGDGVESETAEE